MRLIDADELWMEVIHTYEYCDDFLETIEHQKTIEPTRSNTPNTLETLDCIGRQEAIDEANAWLLDCFGVQKQNRSCGLIRRLEDLPSAQPKLKWIPCSERLPEENVAVNITWVNHDPVPYYKHIKDKPFTATGVYFKGKWYWYSSIITDLLSEYGRAEWDEISEETANEIEVIAWMPLPEPWRGEVNDKNGSDQVN